MRRNLFAAGITLLWLLLFTVAAAAQSESKQKMIDYTIGWQQPNTHLFEITIQTTTEGAHTVDFALPNWRPGRYLIQNYARNVQEFSASDENNQTLAWEKTDKANWRVQTGKAHSVQVHYKFYANILDAGSSQLNDQEAYFNGTNLFMYLVNRRQQACRLKILAPPKWQIVTALPETEPGSFSARDYEELSDSPTIISPTLITTQYQQGKTRYYLVFQGKADYDLQTLTNQVSKITAEQTRIFGSAPFENYWFLYHALPTTRWHGVEHANSTSITMPPNALATEAGRHTFYSFTSHELFHAWNVKRIRPLAFSPPDYNRESYTRLLWFFEGITSYYGDLTLKRAGISDERTFLGELEKLINELQNSPGRTFVSAEEASFNEWLQPDDNENAEISFYTKGELIGLLLDLEIRYRSSNAKSLDDLMRYLNEHYAQQNRGVPEDGIEKAIETVTGSNFQDFFNRYIAGHEELPYNQYLQTVALQVVEEVDKSKPEVYLGIKLSNEERATITNVVPGSPALAAGLDRGDQVLAIDNQQVNAANLTELLNAYKPGDKIIVTVFRARRLRNFEVELTGNGNIIYRLKKVDLASAEQQQAFSLWLSGAK